jgi:hypothetical protein
MTTSSSWCPTVDGTLLTELRIVTDRAAPPCSGCTRPDRLYHRLQPADRRHGISDRTAALSLPFGAFNGSSIVDPSMRPIEHHTIPASVVKRSMEVLQSFAPTSGCSAMTSG